MNAQYNIFKTRVKGNNQRILKDSNKLAKLLVSQFYRFSFVFGLHILKSASRFANRNVLIRTLNNQKI